MFNYRHTFLLAVLRYILCEKLGGDLPFYEPLSFAGLGRVELLHPIGINFSVGDNIDWLDEMILHANINECFYDTNGSQITGTFRKYTYDHYYLWEYINKEIVLKPGDTFYYWISLKSKISVCFPTPVRNFTVLDDGKIVSPPIHMTNEYFKLFSV